MQQSELQRAPRCEVLSVRACCARCAALPGLCLVQNLGKLAEVMEQEHVSAQLLPLFTDLTQDGALFCSAAVPSITL